MIDVTGSFREARLADGSPKVSRARAGAKKNSVFLVGGMYDGRQWTRAAFENGVTTITVEFTPKGEDKATHYAAHIYLLYETRAYWAGLDAALVEQLREQDREWLSSTT